MVNKNELCAAIKRKGYTHKDVAIKLGMSERTFSSKINKGIFGSDEIERMIDILDIKKPVPIFFDKTVTFKDT